MKRYLIVICAAALAFSCSDLAGLEERKEALSGSVASLQETLDALNAEIALVQAVAEGSTVNAVTEDEDSWTIKLSDNTDIVLSKGAVPTGAAPVLTVDPDGWWMADYGKGPSYVTFSDGRKVGAGGVDFVKPVFGVDASGFWTVSLDGGNAFERVKDASGQPVRALPETVPDTFFSNVALESGKLVLTRRNGDVLKLPVVPSFLFSIDGAGGLQPFYFSEKRQFKVTSSGVSSTVIMAPAGWTAVMEGEYLAVTAPSSATRSTLIADSSKDISVLAVSAEGFSRMVTIRTELTGPAPVLEEDDLLGVWNNGEKITIAGIEYSKASNGDAVSLKAVSADQVLETAIPAGGRVCFLEAEAGCNFALTGGALPADAIIVSRYNSKPVTVKFKVATPIHDKSFVARNVVFDARSASVVGFMLNSAATSLAARFHFDRCRFNWKYNKNLISLNSSTSAGGIRSIRIVNSDIDMRVDASATRMTFILAQNCKQVNQMEELVFDNNIVAYDTPKPFNITASGATSATTAGGPSVSVRQNTFWNATPAQTLLFLDTFTKYDISRNLYSVPGDTCGGYFVRITVAGTTATGTISDNVAYGASGTLYDFHSSSAFGERSNIPYIQEDPLSVANIDSFRFIPKPAWSGYGAQR